MKKEKIDNKGLRTHCPNCQARLYKRNTNRGSGKPRGETCSKCGEYVHYNPMLDLPYSDTNVPVHQSKEEIEGFLTKMELREILWGRKLYDNASATILKAKFKDGTGFHFELPVIQVSKSDIIEKQVMRIFYHYIKAVYVIWEMEIMSKAELLLGLLQVGDTNMGRAVGTESMLHAMTKASKLLSEGNDA